MDIRVWEVGKASDNKSEDMDLIAHSSAVMYKDLEFGGFIEIGGNVYRMCMYSPDKDILAVEKVGNFEASPKAITASDYTCPYCKSVDYDAWELTDDEGEHYCGSCRSDLKFKRIRSKSDSSDCSYKVKPIKMSPYTKLI